MRRRLVWLAVVAGTTTLVAFAPPDADLDCYVSAAEESLLSTNRGLAPIALAPLSEGQLAVLNSLERLFLVVDGTSGKQARWMEIPAEGSGLAVDGQIAYVTTSEPAGRLLVIDWQQGEVVRQWRVGHMPTAPVLCSDGQVLYLANRFENRVRSIDLETGEQRTVDVVREPVALGLSARGDRLFVANHLPEVRPFLDDENPVIVSEVSVVDTERMQVVCSIELPNGSQGLRGLAVSPDGRFVAVTHVMSNFVVPTMEVAGGAMNRNAVSLVTTDDPALHATVILDEPRRGAANPWGVCFSPDGGSLVVAHAGTHELSVIDFPALLRRIASHRSTGDLFDDEAFVLLEGIRQRIRLPVAGPRAVCCDGGTIFVAGYFSDNLAAVNLRSNPPAVRQIDLGQGAKPSLARRGEQYFNDATLCFQEWQSCATCHPDGRADALYWDLLNDGIGNTKNTKSLLMAPLTPPVMWRGVRRDAGMAVESGIRHIQFARPSPEQAEAIERYLLEMKTTPSPELNANVLESPKTDDASCAKCHRPGVPRGILSAAGRRGKALFEGKAGCVACHPHPWFTTRETVDGGLGTGVEYDVPSLVEAWRSAPYLHHGDGLSLEETIVDFNLLGRRGNTADLSPAELADLLVYLKSL